MNPRVRWKERRKEENMIRANRENREWENEAWDKQADKAGESREQAQEDPIQKRENDRRILRERMAITLN